MARLSTLAIVLSRILAGYVIACFMAALSMLVVVELMSIGQPVTEGRTKLEDFLNQAGYIPVFAIMTAILAAPVALVAVLISEVTKFNRLWFFLIAGALAAVPALFAGDERSVSDLVRGFLTLGPFGVIAGGSYWLVRHRKWPI